MPWAPLIPQNRLVRNSSSMNLTLQKTSAGNTSNNLDCPQKTQQMWLTTSSMDSNVQRLSHAESLPSDQGRHESTLPVSTYLRCEPFRWRLYPSNPIFHAFSRQCITWAIVEYWTHGLSARCFWLCEDGDGSGMERRRQLSSLYSWGRTDVDSGNLCEQEQQSSWYAFISAK